MRLLYVMNKINGKGGLNRIAFDKINYLIDRYEIEVLYFGKGDETPFYPVDSSVKFHHIEVNANAKFWDKVKTIRKVYVEYQRLLKDIRPDIVVNMNANILSWIIPFVNRKMAKIVELHQSYDGVRIFNENTYGHNSLVSAFSIVLRNITYPMYDRVVVLTHTDKVKWKYRNIDVIQNFTNLPMSTEVKVASHSFIWVGRISHQKGLDYLIQIWDKFRQENHDWNLILIGDAIKNDDVLKIRMMDYLASNKNHRIQYIAKTSEMMKYYGDSAVFISTSRYEGLPLCLVEAATMGKPIIGFDITGNDEVVEDGVNGRLIKPGDLDSFVEAMSELAKDEGKRKQYGKASLEKSKAFNKESIMNKWIYLFENVVTVKGK